MWIIIPREACKVICWWSLGNGGNISAGYLLKMSPPRIVEKKSKFPVGLKIKNWSRFWLSYFFSFCPLSLSLKLSPPSPAHCFVRLFVVVVDLIVFLSVLLSVSPKAAFAVLCDTHCCTISVESVCHVICVSNRWAKSTKLWMYWKGFITQTSLERFSM